MLRLKLVDGSFDPKALAPGSSLRLVAPDGEERTVTVKGLPTTGGRQTKERVDTYREYDIVIPDEDGTAGEREVGIGWTAVPA
jgi:hypothetical protein